MTDEELIKLAREAACLTRRHGPVNTMAGDLTFHDSRAFALTMLARKVDVLTLSRISQHKDLKMLMRYYRESAESVAARI